MRELFVRSIKGNVVSPIYGDRLGGGVFNNHVTLGERKAIRTYPDSVKKMVDGVCTRGTGVVL